MLQVRHIAWDMKAHLSLVGSIGATTVLRRSKAFKCNDHKQSSEINRQESFTIATFAHALCIGAAPDASLLRYLLAMAVRYGSKTVIRDRQLSTQSGRSRSIF